MYRLYTCCTVPSVQAVFTYCAVPFAQAVFLLYNTICTGCVYILYNTISTGYVYILYSTMCTGCVNILYSTMCTGYLYILYNTMNRRLCIHIVQHHMYRLVTLLGEGLNPGLCVGPVVILGPQLYKGIVVTVLTEVKCVAEILYIFWQYAPTFILWSMHLSDDQLEVQSTKL